jgi:CubicO group peptidase (beta-lactamase class C family)
MSLSPAVAQRLEALSDLLPDLIREAGIPGLSVALIEDGSVKWTGEYGVVESGVGEPVTATTVFEAASLSKPVVAYAVLKLVGRGELDLDQPLWDDAGYERLEHDERSRKITARMVLSHTAGTPNWGGSPLDLNSMPGTTWNYSGEGFVFLATMMERRTGLPLNELVQREVFTPLGMTHSSFIWRKDFEEFAATPHDMISRSAEKQKPESANAAASLHTTAVDYGRFVSAVITGEGLPVELAADMFKSQAKVDGWGDEEARGYLDWGLGWGIQRGERGRAIWHWGDNGNFRSFVIAYPERGDGLVYFTNSNNGLSIAETLVGLAFDETHWSLAFLDYQRWDQPRRRARIALRKAFAGDHAAGWERLRNLSDDLGPGVAENELRRLGRFLVEDGQVEVGASILEWGGRTFESAGAFQALAEARAASGNDSAALEAYQSALEIDSSLADELEFQMNWLQDGIQAEPSPILISGEALQEYVGEYGPRTIRRDQGQLLYSRAGASSDVVLIPLTRDLFGLEGSRDFRIRFERSADGLITRLVGLYSDGRID